MTDALPEISYILWGKESSYPDATSDSEPATTCTKFFWHAQTFSDKNTNAITKVKSIAGGRDVVAGVNGRFDSTFTIDAFLTKDEEPWELILGSISGGPSPFTATPTNEIPSFAVEIGYKDYGGSLKRLKFHGCKINSVSVGYDKNGDPIKISHEITAQRFWVTDVLQTPTAPTDSPLVGYEGKLSIPNTTELAGIQTFNLKIAHNLFSSEDAQSRFRKDLVEKARDYTYDLSIFFSSTEGVAMLTDFLGAAGNPIPGAVPTENTMKVELYRGAAENLVFNLTGAFVEDVTNPLDAGGDKVVQKITGFAKTMTSLVITNA